MKKLFIILFIPLLLCSCDSSSSKLTIEKNENISSFIKIDSSLLISSYNSKKDFVLYIGDASCSSCLISHSFIENYIKVTNSLIYFITSEDFLLSKKTLNLPSYDSSSLLFISESIVKDKITYSKKIYSSQPSFNNEINKRLSSSFINNVNDFNEISYDSWSTMYSFDFSSCSTMEDSLNKGDKILLSKNLSCYPSSEYKEKLLNQEMSSFLDINDIFNQSDKELEFKKINDFYLEIKKI